MSCYYRNYFVQYEHNTAERGRQRETHALCYTVYKILRAVSVDVCETKRHGDIDRWIERKSGVYVLFISG